MAENVEKNNGEKPIVKPDVVRNPPDLSDIQNKGEKWNWDSANTQRAEITEKQWGHAGIPPEQPVDKSDND